MPITTTEDLASFIGEGVHTSLRKYTDSDAADRAWHAIRDMPDDEWNTVVTIVAQEIQKALAPPRIELLHHRDPDASCEFTLYLNGVETTEYAEEDIDPGAGYTAKAWAERIAEAEADEDASPAFKAASVAALKEASDSAYITGEYTYDGEED